MFPYIYQSDGFTLGSYGVMLAIAYLTGRYLFIHRINQVSQRPINTELLIICLLIFGIVGAKLMFVIKNPERASLTDWSSITSGTGFSSQGALLAAIITTILFSKLSRAKLDLLLDAAAPAAIMAYLIARIGCFLAGDDCYGVQSFAPWAMAFPNGVAKTDVKVHPLPLYEVIYSFVIWLILIKRQLSIITPYSQFFLLLVLWGACRFFVEFISTNPIKIWGMSGSQFGALLMFIAGSFYFTKNYWLNLGQKKAG